MYFDFLLAACVDISFDDYLSFKPQCSANDLVRQSKIFLWNQLNRKTKFTCGKTQKISVEESESFFLGILPSTCHFQYIEPLWPYLRDNNIHRQREDIQWSSIQHSILDKKHLHRTDLSVINSIVDQECHLGENISIHNSIVANRVTLGKNSVLKSVDFSKEVRDQWRFFQHEISTCLECSFDNSTEFNCSTNHFVVAKQQ